MTSINVESIKNHADVIASCGTKVGEVDHLVGADQIKLTKHGDGHHHLIPTSWVGEIKGEKVILTKDSQEVKDTWLEVQIWPITTEFYSIYVCLVLKQIDTYFI